MRGRPPSSTLFPTTPLSRSLLVDEYRLSRRHVAHQAERQAVERHALGGQHPFRAARRDRKSTRLNSSHSQISYAVFCLKKKTIAQLYAGSPATARSAPAVTF